MAFPRATPWSGPGLQRRAPGRRRRRIFLPLAILATGLTAGRAAAVGPVTLRTDVAFYGDNTEFFNPYRTGETLFGVHGRTFLETSLGPAAALRAGAFAQVLFGSEQDFEQIRPVIALRITHGSQLFVLGTLETVRLDEGTGPDRGTLHGLLPPLQAEALVFARPNEQGAQWLLRAPRARSDLWINWRRLNTAQHRELFDAGTAGEALLVEPLALNWQFHVVHEGGQLFHPGPVADSYGGGAGLVARLRPPGLDRAELGLWGLLSHDTPDRQDAGSVTDGWGAFLRAGAERGPWRAHAIFWRARDFVKEEGDANYLSVSAEGEFIRSWRSYAEAGLTRVFRPLAGVDVEASARLHRIDARLEYSYRLLASVRFDLLLRE